MHPDYYYNLSFPFDIRQELLTEENKPALLDLSYVRQPPAKGASVFQLNPVVFEKNNPELYELLSSMNLNSLNSTIRIVQDCFFQRRLDSIEIR